MPDESPTDAVTLGEVYRAVQRIEKILVLGNGQPAVVTRLGAVEGRLDAHEDLLAYDRSQIDTLRSQPKRAAAKWGGGAGAIVTIIGGVLVFVLEALGRK